MEGVQIPINVKFAEPTNEKATKHLAICNQLNDIYIRKNKDYGNSFGEQFAEWGIASAVIRIEDKYRRIKQLCMNKAQVEDEKIEDTLLDLANYAIMTLIEMEESKAD
jgi:hypothetical protein